ncbi:hypothetical protein [Pedobacter sp. BMA]|uniref:hypothetical protein n=1 Tax=Pedobacter sp. BMA TaxID=1663685 RepID=UPI00064ACA63|nr:hypothetical protein [Pedobacter sp. BMA]KLT64294.1 hypothetical protein AB669_17175 [Pedobacter sp. BMA]
MRKGRIISIDNIDQTGMIIDENEQEIPFHANPKGHNLKLNDNVIFEIALTISGLSAIITGL